MSKIHFESYFSSLSSDTFEGKAIKSFLDPANDFSIENLLFDLEAAFDTTFFYKQHFHKDTPKKDIIGEIGKLVGNTGYIKKRKVEVKQICDELIMNSQRHGSDSYRNTIYISKSAERGLIATLNQLPSELDTNKIRAKFLHYQQSQMSDVGPIDWNEEVGANIGIDLILHQSISFGMLLRNNIILCFSIFAIANKQLQDGCRNIVFGKISEKE